MGRAMLIIAAGAIIAVGILQLGVQGKRSSIAKNAAVNAYDVEMRNKAFTAAQVTMEVINEYGNESEAFINSKLPTEIDGTPVNVGLTIIPNTSTTTFAELEEETVVINTTASYDDPMTGKQRSINIITSYVKEAMHFVPEFKGAMQFAVPNGDFKFNVKSSATQISGTENSGSGNCTDKPAVVVTDEESKNVVDLGKKDDDTFAGSAENIQIDSELSYEPVDELVARLANMNGVQNITSENVGDYDNYGSADSPGVFFVEDDVKFASNAEGFGIMVVRNQGSISSDSTFVIDSDGNVKLTGKFTFNGLVIFENAYSMTGNGTAAINGSVLVGKAKETYDQYDQIDIDLNGTFDIRYDCVGEKYAQAASATALKQNRYKRLSTYE
ncbi:hypothetical protein ACKGJO_05730 [Gracilimonas sp. Q87]|uniref:hypothetical protein n=1 Tax=Gracilimonas sp. Q87 TaxID=3384766 RepID=UPI003984192E